MKNKFFPFLLCFLFLTACETVVDVEIESFESALIVEGGILHHTDGTTNQQVISLTRAVDFLDEGNPIPVPDITIMVSDGENNFFFDYVGEGVYTADIPTEIGKYYQVEIMFEGDLIIGGEVLNNIAPIDSIYSTFEEETTFTDEGYSVRIDTQDALDERNFYHWRVFINDTLSIVPDLGNSTNLIAKDDFFDGQELIGYTPNEEARFEIGDSVKVEQLGITERYHDFLYQIYRQTGSIPLAGDPPPSRIRGNLVNETNAEKYVLGYFTVGSVTSAEMMIE
ncbi:MAG: DUF4249 domain-containing protein [Bacteroidota bacterium]